MPARLLLIWDHFSSVLRVPQLINHLSWLRNYLATYIQIGAIHEINQVDNYYEQYPAPSQMLSSYTTRLHIVRIGLEATSSSFCQ